MHEDRATFNCPWLFLVRGDWRTLVVVDASLDAELLHALRTNKLFAPQILAYFHVFGDCGGGGHFT